MFWNERYEKGLKRNWEKFRDGLENWGDGEKCRIGFSGEVGFKDDNMIMQRGYEREPWHRLEITTYPKSPSYIFFDISVYISRFNKI